MLRRERGEGWREFSTPGVVLGIREQQAWGPDAVRTDLLIADRKVVQHEGRLRSTVATDAEERSNPIFVPVVHGKMVTNVPLGIFKGRSSVIDRSQVGEFRVKPVGRHAWFSPDALDVILAGASRARAEQMEKERTPVQKGRDLVSNGGFTESIRLLERHLRSCPEDGGTWQVMGGNIVPGREG